MNNENYQERINEKLDKAFKKEERSITGFFIKNYRFTYLIVFAIMVTGLYSLITLPREADPEIEVPFAAVVTVYPGANPTDVEELITNELENEIKNLDNLNRFTSSSGEGISSIFVEFDADAPLVESFRKLRTAVDNAKTDLPGEAEDPQVVEINITDYPIITYSLVGEYTNAELKRLADTIKDEFESIRNVSEVNILGGQEREYQIIVDPVKLANYGLSLGQVAGAITRGNFNLPAGSIEVDGFKYSVRLEGKFKNAEPLNNIVVTTKNETPIYIKDIANVVDGFKDVETESRIGFNNQASKNTISLQIKKKSGGNILEIVNESKIKIEEMQSNEIIPKDLVVQKTNDNSVFIKDDLYRLGTSALQTMALITLFLLIVLSLRGALITGASVPIAFLMTFFFLKYQSMTLNSMVLFSLVLSLGLMVDNSIIIIEGISEYISKHKKTPYEAAILSVWNFKWPVIAGTMTTVSAFLPMLLVSGILGQYISILPKTISVALLSSLFVALVVIPTLASRFIKLGTASKSHRDKKRHVFIEGKMEVLKKHYEKLLRNVLPSKKKRRSMIIGAWLLFFVSIAIPITGIMKTELFSKVDIDYFVVNIELPIGSTLDKTKVVTLEAEKIISKLPEVDNYVTNIGTSISLGLSSDAGSNGTHLANITVNLIDKDLRDKKSFEIAENVRPVLEQIPGAKITVEELSAGPPTGAPIEVRLKGDDLKVLAKLAEDVKAYFDDIPGVINIKDNLQEASGEFTFSIDRQQADYYGLDILTIASTLRTAVYGQKASNVSLEDEDIDITVKYANDIFKDTSDLENILLPTPQGGTVSLKQISDLRVEPSLLSISHRDGDRVVLVTAELETGTDLAQITKDFEAYIPNFERLKGYDIELGGEVEDIQKSFQETFLSMIIAVILIAVILVLQFNSFRQPFIILFTLPLAIIGAIFGLFVLAMPFSFTVFIGLVALAGIVVNDAIVLIDRINKNLDDGMEFVEGIIEAGLARMQPIFLTSITTVAGIFPLIFADELWRGLSITVIFGLIFSTVLTLVMVPVVFAGLCLKEKCK